MSFDVPALWHWCAAHPYAASIALGALVLFVLASVLNGRLPHAALRTGSWPARTLGAALDLVAFIARKDSPGSLLVPFLTRSAAPLVQSFARDVLHLNVDVDADMAQAVLGELEKKLGAVATAADRANKSLNGAGITVNVSVPPAPDATAPQTPSTKRGEAGFVSMRALALLLAACSLVLVPMGLALHGCGVTPRQAVAATIVGAGAGLASLHQSHEDAYTAATDALRASLHDGGTVADYDARVAPLNAAFRARGAALAALDADLYGAAAVVDATRSSDPAAYLPAVQPVLDALRRDLAVLQDGSVLPALPIPASVTSTVATLETLAAGVTHAAR
jgi:hypothetical protein